MEMRKPSDGRVGRVVVGVGVGVRVLTLLRLLLVPASLDGPGETGRRTQKGDVRPIN